MGIMLFWLFTTSQVLCSSGATHTSNDLSRRSRSVLWWKNQSLLSSDQMGSILRGIEARSLRISDNRRRIPIRGAVVAMRVSGLWLYHFATIRIRELIISSICHGQKHVCGAVMPCA